MNDTEGTSLMGDLSESVKKISEVEREAAEGMQAALAE